MHLAKEQNLKRPFELLLHLGYDLQVNDPEKYEAILKNYSDLIEAVLEKRFFVRKKWKYRPLLRVVGNPVKTKGDE